MAHFPQLMPANIDLSLDLPLLLPWPDLFVISLALFASTYSIYPNPSLDHPVPLLLTLSSSESAIVDANFFAFLDPSRRIDDSRTPSNRCIRRNVRIRFTTMVKERIQGVDTSHRKIASTSGVFCLVGNQPRPNGLQYPRLEAGIFERIDAQILQYENRLFDIRGERPFSTTAPVHCCQPRNGRVI